MRVLLHLIGILRLLLSNIKILPLFLDLLHFIKGFKMRLFLIWRASALRHCQFIWVLILLIFWGISISLGRLLDAGIPIWFKSLKSIKILWTPGTMTKVTFKCLVLLTLLSRFFRTFPLETVFCWAYHHILLIRHAHVFLILYQHGPIIKLLISLNEMYWLLSHWLHRRKK